MAPLPSNSTAVLFVDYELAGIGHTIQCRYNSGGSTGDAMAAVDAFLTAITPRILQISITGARVRDVGGSVTYPVTWTGEDTYGDGTPAAYHNAWYYDFVGRSIGGRRVRVSVFGADEVVDANNYRATVAEDATIAAALAVLEASSDVFVAIDGDPAGWHQYANLGTNAYWRNHLR